MSFFEIYFIFIWSNYYYFKVLFLVNDNPDKHLFFIYSPFHLKPLYEIHNCSDKMVYITLRQQYLWTLTSVCQSWDPKCNSLLRRPRGVAYAEEQEVPRSACPPERRNKDHSWESKATVHQVEVTEWTSAVSSAVFTWPAPALWRQSWVKLNTPFLDWGLGSPSSRSDLSKTPNLCSENPQAMLEYPEREEPAVARLQRRGDTELAEEI